MIPRSPTRPHAVSCTRGGKAGRFAYFRSTHWCSISHSKVRITESRMVNVGFQPVSRILFVSRKMNGLSPIQPLLPPVNSSLGSTPRRPQIQEIESLTEQYSFVPRL